MSRAEYMRTYRAKRKLGETTVEIPDAPQAGQVHIGEGALGPDGFEEQRQPPVRSQFWVSPYISKENPLGLNEKGQYHDLLPAKAGERMRKRPGDDGIANLTQKQRDAILARINKS